MVSTTDVTPPHSSDSTEKSPASPVGSKEQNEKPSIKENETDVAAIEETTIATPGSKEAGDEADEDAKYPGGWSMAVLTFGLVMAIFVVALDNTILATAIPKITTVFDSLNDVGWYGSSYLLTQTSLQPSFGKVYTYFNVKWTFLISLLIFELGSIICAAAVNSPMLIVGRAVAGVGSAAIFSGAVTIVAYSVPLRKRPMYVACIGSVFGISAVIVQVKRGDKATIPPRIFIKQRTVLATSWYAMFLVMGVYVHIFYIPFYFQAVKGTSAVGSGVRNIPLLGGTTIGSLLSGALVTYVGYYTPFLTSGAAMFTVGAGLIYTWAVDTNTGRWIGYQLVAGIGAGIGIQLPFIAVQTVLEPKDIPTGNAISIFFNSMGGAFSISIAQNIFSNKLVEQLPIRAPGVNAEAVVKAGATHIRDSVSSEALRGVLEAYSYALDQAFVLPIAVGALAFICSFFVEWRSVKGKSPLAAGAA
ncbi:MAG: hypothetical protein M1814_005523 [Vezdaea aestivalis]|nr:MAG: hypothetical protein M1814_005523 [Vezdaea aestivalis]